MKFLKKFLFLFIFLVIFIFPVNVIVVTYGDYSHVELLGEKEIKIAYIHSVERSEVVEILKANKSGLYTVEMWWKDFGAGLPENFQYVRDGYYVKKLTLLLGILSLFASSHSIKQKLV